MNDTFSLSLVNLRFRLTKDRAERQPDNEVVAELLRLALSYTFYYTGYVVTSPYGTLFASTDYYRQEVGSTSLMLLPYRSRRSWLWRIKLHGDLVRWDAVSAVESASFIRQLLDLSARDGIHTHSYGVLSTSGVFMPIDRTEALQMSFVTGVPVSALEDADRLPEGLLKLVTNAVAVGKGWRTRRLDGIWVQEFTYKGVPVRLYVRDCAEFLPSLLKNRRFTLEVQASSGPLSGMDILLGMVKLDTALPGVRWMLRHGKDAGQSYAAVYPHLRGGIGKIVCVRWPLSGAAPGLLRYWQVEWSDLAMCPFHDADEIYYLPGGVFLVDMSYSQSADGSYASYLPPRLVLDPLAARRGDWFLLPFAFGLGEHTLAMRS